MNGIRRALRITTTLAKDILYKSRWRIGIIDRPIHEVRSEDMEDVVWLEPMQDSMSMADPFGFTDGGREYILFEEYEPPYKIGRIAAIEYMGDGKYMRLPDPFTENTHMSYPFVIEYDSDIFLIRENIRASDIEMFRLSDMKVCEKIAIVNDFTATDPSVVFYRGKWWMFCTRADNLECEILYIFHSESLTDGWKPHAGNPVKRDIGSSRSAGTPFIVDGIVYRPSQDCSREYGKRISVNRVEILNENEFHEKPCYYIDAKKAYRYRDGIHTLSKFGNRTLIDAKIRLPRIRLTREV